MRFLSCLLLLVFLTSCGEEVIKKPEDLIPPDKMVEILYDIALINAGKGTSPRILEDYDIKTMGYIYEKYGIDSARLVNSDIYYASKPLEYRTIYKRVESHLEEEKELLEAARREVSDSVRREAERRRAAAAAKKSTD